MNYKDKFTGIKLTDGFCNGFFGRDSYEVKIIIASGDSWIVAKDDYGHNHFADFKGSEHLMEEYIEQWSKWEDEV